jgi:trigger factor
MELIQNNEGLVATLTVKVSEEDYAAKVEKELKKLRQTAHVKGFRPGNVPMSLIKKMYGSPIMIDEINKLILNSIKGYEQENAGRLFSPIIPSESNQPLLVIDGQKEFEFIYEAGLFPNFTFRIDENFELPYYNIVIDEDDINVEIDAYRDAYYKSENIEKVEDDCMLGVDISVVKDGAEKLQHTHILMSVIPDEYKSMFIGAGTNDTLNIEIRKVFTNETDLMGMLQVNKNELELQPETLSFTITEITKKQSAELTQEFFDKVAGKDKIHNEAELRETIREILHSTYSRLSLDQLYKDSIAILLAHVNIDIPEAFVRRYIRFIQKDDEEMSDEDFEATVEYFVRETKWKYIVSSLLEQGEVVITYNMVKEEVRNIINDNYPQYINLYSDEDISELTNQYMKNEEYMKNVLARIKNKQLAKLLKENAKLNVTDITVDKFYEIYYLSGNTSSDNTPENNSEIIVAENKENNTENSHERF